jgi:GntR family transcriptional repressor for pyruvate dehydrogenase complex
MFTYSDDRMTNMIKENPIKKINISESVLKRIVELIRNGDLKSGDKLPSIQLFSEKLQVGASSVREALKQLQIMGILEIKQGEGTFVKERVGLDSLSNYLGYLLDLKKQDILHLMEVRKIIERGAVALAAERASEDDINKLGNIIQRMREIIDEPPEFAEENVEFHLAIAEASKNPILSIIFNSVYDLFMKEQQVVAKMLNLKFESIESHINIWTAIKNHNINKAIKEMEKHLNHIQKTILRS